MITFVTRASVCTVRFGLDMAGCRDAVAAEQRWPFFCVSWYQPTPSWRGPLKSSLAFAPCSWAAAMNALQARDLYRGSGAAGRPAGAVVRSDAAGVVLGPPEVRHEVLVAPAGAAVLVPPALEVVAVAANVDHRVDRGRGAEDLNQRPVDGPAGRAVLRDGQVVPVVFGLEQPVQGGGGADLLGVIGRPGFQEQDADGGIGGQARRQDAARASGADDDVVIHAVSPVPWVQGTITRVRAGG